jgi:hypothetical protein
VNDKYRVDHRAGAWQEPGSHLDLATSATGAVASAGGVDEPRLAARSVSLVERLSNLVGV